MALIDVRNLSKAYGDVRAVDGISFAIEQGEIFGLLGPNGAGKSTTINRLSAYTETTNGQIHVDGIDVIAHPERVKPILGVVPQDLALYPPMQRRREHALLRAALRRARRSTHPTDRGPAAPGRPV